MSFTYQRTHKSVCIDTRPNLHSARSLFDSDSEDEEEYDGQVEQGPRPLALTYEQPPDSEPELAGDPTWWFKPGLGMEIKIEIDPTMLHTLCPFLFEENRFFRIHSVEKEKAPTLVQPSKIAANPSSLLTQSLLCYAVILLNVHWTRECSQLDTGLLCSHFLTLQKTWEKYFYNIMKFAVWTYFKDIFNFEEPVKMCC